MRRRCYRTGDWGLNRRSFVISGATAVSALGIFPANAYANAKTTIVCVHCSVPDLEEQGEDILSGGLRANNIPTVDPSAIETTYHERARLFAQRYADAIVVDYENMAWVTTKYRAGRLLTAFIDIASNPLPYGDFTVFNVRARISYRMFDTIDKKIICGGSTRSMARSEDERASQDDAISDGLGKVVSDVARKLLHLS